MSQWIDINIRWNLKKVSGSYSSKDFEHLRGKSSEEIAVGMAKVREDKRKIDEDNLSKSFCGLGLNKSGTLIEVKSKYGDTKRYLIGDIGPFGSSTDICSDIEDDAIITRYKKILDDDYNPVDKLQPPSSYYRLIIEQIDSDGVYEQVFKFATKQEAELESKKYKIGSEVGNWFPSKILDVRIEETSYL